MKNCEKNITAIIKTFERPWCCDRLIESIRKYYNDIHIIVADDSQNPQVVKGKNIEYHILPFDCGLSYGRNFLVEKVKTKYFLLLDDDYVFIKKTDLSLPFDILENNPMIDIVGGIWTSSVSIGSIFERKKGNIYFLEGTHKKTINGYKIYERIQNFFVAKTKKVQKYKWDNDLKVNEHTDFFYTHRNKFTITATPQFQILHDHQKHEEKYNKYRIERSELYSDIFLRRNNANSLIKINKNKDEIVFAKRISSNYRKKIEQQNNDYFISDINAKFITIEKKKKNNKKHIWILARVRTGSTWLSEMLSSPELGSFIEDFRLYNTEMPFRIPRTSKVLQEHWLRVRDKTKSLSKMEEISGPKRYILLRRKNLFEQAVSWYIADYSKIWVTNQISKNNNIENITIPYDIEQMYRMYRYIKEYDDFWLYELNWNSLAYHELWYEDLKDDTVEELNKIYDFLEIKKCKKEIIKKINECKEKPIIWNQKKHFVEKLKEYSYYKENKSKQYYFYIEREKGLFIFEKKCRHSYAPMPTSFKKIP